MELLDHAQTYEHESLLLYDGTLYVEVAVVDDWLDRRAVRDRRAEAVRRMLMERIRKVRKAKEDGIS